MVFQPMIKHLSSLGQTLARAVSNTSHSFKQSIVRPIFLLFNFLHDPGRSSKHASSRIRFRPSKVMAASRNSEANIKREMRLHLQLTIIAYSSIHMVSDSFTFYLPFTCFWSSKVTLFVSSFITRSNFVVLSTWSPNISQLAMRSSRNTQSGEARMKRVVQRCWKRILIRT